MVCFCMVFGHTANGPKSSTNLGEGGWTLAGVTPETLYISAKIVYILYVIEWYVFEWFLGIVQVVQNHWELIWRTAFADFAD